MNKRNGVHSECLLVLCLADSSSIFSFNAIFSSSRVKMSNSLLWLCGSILSPSRFSLLLLRLFFMPLDFDFGIGIPLRRIGESISSSYKMAFSKTIKSMATATKTITPNGSVTNWTRFVNINHSTVINIKRAEKTETINALHDQF